MRTDRTSAAHDEAAVSLDPATEAAGDARERFINDLQTLAGHAQEPMHQTTAISTESVAAAREPLRESLGVAGESIRKFQAGTLDRGRKVVEPTDSYVRENPWQAIAIGMVAGLAPGVAGGSMATRGLAARA